MIPSHHLPYRSTIYRGTQPKPFQIQTSSEPIQISAPPRLQYAVTGINLKTPCGFTVVVTGIYRSTACFAHRQGFCHPSRSSASRHFGGKLSISIPFGPSRVITGFPPRLQLPPSNHSMQERHQSVCLGPRAIRFHFAHPVRAVSSRKRANHSAHL